jgi:hypothetical protein
MIIKRPGAARLLRDETAMAAHFRKIMRGKLSDLLANWEPWEAWIEPDGTAYVARYGDHGNAVKFKPRDLRKALSIEHYELFRTLFELLREQSQVALWAVNVAKMELNTDARRKRGGSKTSVHRKDEAEKRHAELVKVANQIQAVQGSMPNTDWADLVAERTGRGKEAIRKKLPRKKLPKLLHK